MRPLSLKASVKLFKFSRGLGVAHQDMRLAYIHLLSHFFWCVYPQKSVAKERLISWHLDTYS